MSRKPSAPFHEYHREDMVSSRTYLTPEEQTMLAIQELKAIPKAHFLLKTPESSACFVQAPWVDEPWISKRTLAEKLSRVYDQPYYVRLDAPQDRQEPVPIAPARVASKPTPPDYKQPLIPEVLPPEEPSDNEEPDEYDLFH